MRYIRCFNADNSMNVYSFFFTPAANEQVTWLWFVWSLVKVKHMYFLVKLQWPTLQNGNARVGLYIVDLLTNLPRTRPVFHTDITHLLFGNVAIWAILHLPEIQVSRNLVFLRNFLWMNGRREKRLKHSEIWFVSGRRTFRPRDNDGIY